MIKKEIDSTGVRAEARRSELQKANLDGGVVRLVAIPTYTISGRSAEIQLGIQLQVELDEPTVWRQLLNRWITPLRDLVALGAAAPTQILEVWVSPASTPDEARPALELRYPLSAPRRPGDRHGFEMPMRATELPERFHAGVNHWWKIRASQQHALQAMGGLLHAPFIYLEDRFVALTRAAEAFHAVELSAVDSATVEHAARIERVRAATESLDADDAAWLESVLEWSQAPIARHRIRDLVSGLGDAGMVLAGGDPDRFAKAVTQTRNLITHPQSAPGSGALVDVEARFWHSEALLWLLRGWLLKALGFSVEEIAVRLDRSPRYRHVVELMEQLGGGD